MAVQAASRGVRARAPVVRTGGGEGGATRELPLGVIYKCRKVHG
jgi:hypothetical protein